MLFLLLFLLFVFLKQEESTYLCLTAMVCKLNMEKKKKTNMQRKIEGNYNYLRTVLWIWKCKTGQEKEDLPGRAAGAGGLGWRRLDKGSSSFFVLLSILCPLSSSPVRPGPLCSFSLSFIPSSVLGSFSFFIFAFLSFCPPCSLPSFSFYRVKIRSLSPRINISLPVCSAFDGLKASTVLPLLDCWWSLSSRLGRVVGVKVTELNPRGSVGRQCGLEFGLCVVIDLLWPEPFSVTSPTGFHLFFLRKRRAVFGTTPF